LEKAIPEQNGQELAYENFDVDNLGIEITPEPQKKKPCPLPGVTRSYPVPPDASCGVCSDTPMRAGFNPFKYYDQ
jgi:hypothetical protein